MSTINSELDVSNYNVVLYDDYSYDQEDLSWSNLEKTFNIFGYIPVLGTISGANRITIGTVMIIAGVGMAVLHNMGGFYKNAPESYFISQMGHGFANIIRGSIEAVPGAGNLATLTYDIFCGRIKYPIESKTPLYVLFEK